MAHHDVIWLPNVMICMHHRGRMHAAATNHWQIPPAKPLLSPRGTGVTLPSTLGRLAEKVEIHCQRTESQRDSLFLSGEGRDLPMLLGAKRQSGRNMPALMGGLYQHRGHTEVLWS